MRRLAVVISWIAIVTACSGGGSSPTPTAAPSPEATRTSVAAEPTLSPGWSRYSDPDYGFVVDYPPGWLSTRKPALNIKGFYSPEHAPTPETGGRTVYVGVVAILGTSGITLEQLAEQRPGIGPRPRVVGTRPTTVDGLPAIELRTDDYGFTQITTYVIANGKPYSIDIRGTSLDAVEAHHADYDAMVASLRLP